MHGSSDGGRHRGRSVRKNQVGIGRAGFSVLKRIWLMLVVFAPPNPLGVAKNCSHNNSLLLLSQLGSAGAPTRS